MGVLGDSADYLTTIRQSPIYGVMWFILQYCDFQRITLISQEAKIPHASETGYLWCHLWWLLFCGVNLFRSSHGNICLPLHQMSSAGCWLEQTHCLHRLASLRVGGWPKAPVWEGPNLWYRRGYDGGLSGGVNALRWDLVLQKFTFF